MSDPNELSDDTRALLRIARSSGVPDAGSLARVRASVLREVAVGSVAIGVAAGASKVAGSAPPAIGSAATSTSILTVVAKSAALIAIVGTSAAALRGYEPVTSAAPPGRSTPSTSTVGAPMPTSITTVAVAVPSTIASGDEPSQKILSPAELAKSAPVPTLAPRLDPSAVRRARAGVPVVASASTETPSTPSSAAARSLADELARLREAHLALAAGQPERALEAAEGVEDASSLSVERDGLRTLARCAIAKRITGDEAASRARAEGERFLAVHPDVSIGARVRRACDVR